MQMINFKHTKNVSILALGAESAGNFSIYLSHPYHSLLNKERCLVVETERSNGKIYFSKDFGDLLEETNWKKYQKKVLSYLKDNKIKPEIILTDLHPLYKTTVWGKELAKKYNAKHISIQHHFAHIFSAIGDKLINYPNHQLPITNYGIAMDGTGFGTDEKIWGGEIFQVESRKNKAESIKRIGHLENQVMIGGDLAVREPARIVLSILNKFMDKISIYQYMEKFYTSNQFELIYNQLQQNFNCLETSSIGRVLDAVSILLGFCGNVRKYKHEPIDLLEKNSTLPYSDLKPKIIFDEKEKKHILLTTPLFEYLLKNIKKDKRRLAATAQFYIAEGLYEILLKCHPEFISGSKKMPKPAYWTSRQVRHDNFFISGGIANNKIISSFLESKGVYGSKLTPRGDAGISFGQIIYHLFN